MTPAVAKTLMAAADAAPIYKGEHRARMASPGLRILSLADLDALPEPRWLIDGVLPEDAFGALFGQPASFKSFVALSLSLAIAAGVTVMGREVRSGPVLYCAAEGAFRMKARVAAWRKENGQNNPAPFFLVPGAVSLLDKVGVDALLTTIQAVSDITGTAPKLIVLDTWARFLAGADENSASDVGRAVAVVDEVRQHWGCAVLAVHHAGKTDNGMRGSSAMLGAVDVAIAASRVTGTDTVTLSCDKMKDGPNFSPISLNAHPVGESLVLRHVDYAVQPERQRKLSERLRLARDVLADAIAANGSKQRASSDQPATTLANWRQELVRRGMLDNLPADAARAAKNNVSAAFSKLRGDLVAAHVAAVNGDLIWITGS